jgi:hypothetical protein
MRGAITIKNLEVETNVNGNYVVYGQHTHEDHATPIELRPIPSLVNQMCLVYDESSGKFVPQDLATYVENTPSFENKIKEVAGTATLIAPDGVPVVPKVTIYDDSSYLPLVGNKNGDMAFATDTESFYIWNINQWLRAGANVTADYNTLSNVPTIPTDVSDLTDTSNLLTVSSNVSANAEISTISISQSNELTVTTGTAKLYVPFSINIVKSAARVETAPTGANVTVTVLKNNSIVDTLSIAANSTKVVNNSLNIPMVEDDYITMNVTNIGSVIPGADLLVTLYYTKG